MQCPNCNAQVFENDRFCGECGTDVSAVTMKGKEINHVESNTNAQAQPEQQAQPKQQAQSNHAASNNYNVGTYFKTVLSFVKNAFVKPGTMIGGNKIYAPSVTSGTVAIGTMIFSLFLFIMARSTAGLYMEVPFSFLFRVFFVLAILIAAFYAVTMLMNVLLLKTKVSWQQVMHDYAVSTTIVLGLFIIALAFLALTLIEIAVIFLIIGSLLFITAPIYIFLKYANDNNVKFDSYYSLVIYFVINAVVYYILIRVAIGQSLAELERLFMY